MISKTTINLLCAAIAVIPFISYAQNHQAQPADHAEKLNYPIKWLCQTILIDIDEKYSPEFGSRRGLSSTYTVPTAANKASERKDKEIAVVTFKEARQKETSIAVKQGTLTYW